MVMKPEPWGEALDAAGRPAAGRPTVLVVPTPERGRRSPRRSPRELASREHLVFACGRYEGIDQRVLDEAAAPDRGARGLARRLRAQRRRGGRAGDHRGGRAAAARASWATRSRWPRSPTRTACWSTPSTPSPPRWRGHDVPAGAALRRPRRDRGLAPRPVAYAAPRERRPDLAHPAAPSALGDVDLEVRLATPADAGELLTLQRACWVQEQRANPGVAIPALRRVARRRAGRGSASGTTLVVARRRAGWSAPCAAGCRRRRRLGHRAADGRPRPAGPRARAGCCSSAIEAAAPAEAHVVRAVHRRRQRAQPADVQEGRLPARGRRAGRRAWCVMTKRRRALTSISGARPRLWQTCPRSSRPKDRSARRREGPRRLLPQGEHGAAGHHGWTHQLNTIRYRG